MNLRDEINSIKSIISPIVEEHYPSKANHEKMSLYDLITFGIITHKHFSGVYKRAYVVLIDDLKLFPKVRYNKVVERLNRYEVLLMECIELLFKLDGLRIVDSKPIETKRLSRVGRHNKIGGSYMINEEESVGFNTLKGGST
jgi:hypothetical protein